MDGHVVHAVACTGAAGEGELLALFLYLSSPQLADNMAKFAAMAAAK